MIQRERIADNVYAFQSDLYVQVTAGVVVGPEWAVAIDTLAFPEETLAIRDFVEHELKVPIRYVINTHYHVETDNLYTCIVIMVTICGELHPISCEERQCPCPDC